jgi:hypothetical protein
MNGTALYPGTQQYVPAREVPNDRAEIPATASTPASDKSTKAALAFFEAKDGAAVTDALEHLVAIALKARGGKFLTERGRTWFEATHEFFEEWLLKKLLPYREARTFHMAAQRGEFAYLAKQSRNALIDELRRRARSVDPLCRNVVRMDATIDSDDDNSWLDLLGVGSDQEGGCPIGTKPSLEPSALQRKLRERRAEISKSLGESLFDVLFDVCQLFPDQLSLGDVTRGIARARAVSDQTARKLHHALARKLSSLKGDPVVRELIELISNAGDPIRLSADSWDGAQCQRS